MKITETVARKVLSIVDAGLSKGLGNRKAGQMLRRSCSMLRLRFAQSIAKKLGIGIGAKRYG